MSKFRKPIKESWSASDLIRSSRSGVSGKLKQLVGMRLLASGVLKSVLSDLHKFGLLYQKGSQEKFHRNVVAQKLRDGFTFKKG